MNNLPQQPDIQVIALIEKLQAVPQRNPRAVANGRLKFLAEARTYRATEVSAAREQRHMEWKIFFSRKAQLKMSILTTLITLCAIIFASTGATVYAAQDSLPDEGLYRVKLVSEDIQASLPASTHQHVTFAMDLADLRLHEAIQLADEGKSIPSTVWDRMEQHIDLGLTVAASLADPPLHEELLRVQARLKADLPKVAQLAADSRYRPAVERAQAVLQAHLLLVQIGLDDPAAFRHYMQSDQQPASQPSATAIATATALTITPMPQPGIDLDDDDDDEYCTTPSAFNDDDCDDDLEEDIEDDDDNQDDNDHDDDDDDNDDDDDHDNDGEDDPEED